MIPGIFENTARRFPENIAVDDNRRTITYAELNTNANRIAHALAEAGLTGSSIAGLYFDASIEYITAVLGVLKAGAIFLPLSTQYPEKRLTDILNKTEPRVFITNASLESEASVKLQPGGHSSDAAHILVLEDTGYFTIKNSFGGTVLKEWRHFPGENPLLNTDPDGGCYIVTTSGSTGEPKAILGCHKGLDHFINWEIGEFHLDQDVRVSLLSPLTFDVSLRDIFVPLIAGGTLCIPDDETRYNPLKLFHWLRHSRITLMHIVPTLFRLLTREIEKAGGNDGALPDLRYVLLAGESLYGNDISNWRRANGSGIELVNLYGPSETTLAKLFYRIKDEHFADGETVPIGKPIPETEVLIIKDGKSCRVDETGEIHLKTPFMSKGYYNAPGLNDTSFVPNPVTVDYQDIVYKTGDQGKFTSDGIVRFEGRLDGQIKLYGNRVEMGEIEVILRQHPQVKEAVVAAREDTPGDQRLAAYVVPADGGEPTGAELREYIGRKLPDYMVPSYFITLDALPQTSSGKIDRKALPAPEAVPTEPKAAYVPPGNRLQQAIAGIWQEVLNVPRIGMNDNFFELGGHSLLAMQIISRISHDLKVGIEIRSFFESPTIKGIARLIQKSEGSDTEQTTSPIITLSRASRRTKI